MGGQAAERSTHAGGAQAAAGWGEGWAVSTEGGEPHGRLRAQERQDLPGEDLKEREQEETVRTGRSRGNQGTWCAKSSDAHLSISEEGKRPLYMASDRPSP